MDIVIDANSGAQNDYKIVSIDGGMNYEIVCLKCGKRGKKDDQLILKGNCHK